MGGYPKTQISVLANQPTLHSWEVSRGLLAVGVCDR